MSSRAVRRLAMTTVAALVLVLATFVTARATRVDAGPYAPTPTPTPTPTTTFTTFTNNTGEAAGFLHVQSFTTLAELPSGNAPGCGTPTIFGSGFEYWEITWPSPCVDPGESVSFEGPSFFSIGYYWAASVPVVSAVNDTGLPSNDLRIATASFIKGATLVQNAPGCPAPFYQFPSSGTVELTWSSACVDPGEKVSIHVGAPEPVTSATFLWSGPVGGVSLDPSDTPLDSSSSRTAMLLTAVAGVVAVGIIALGSAPWFARRRRVR